MSDDHNVQIAILKTEQDYIKKSVDEMRDDLREIKEVLSQAKGGWKTLLLVAGVSSAVGGLLVKLSPWLAFAPK